MVPHTLVPIGQSYARVAYRQGEPALDVLSEALRRTGRVSELHCINYAVDGSAVIEENDGGNGYWTEPGGPGPLLLRVQPLTTRGLVVCSIGEQDAGMTRNDAKSFVVKDAIRSALWRGTLERLGARCPIWVDLLGPRKSWLEHHEYRMRDRLIELCEEEKGVFRGAEKYPLELNSTDHPTTEGNIHMAAQTGRKIAAWLNGEPELCGPRIAVIEDTSSRVEISIDAGGKDFIRPPEPDYFAAFDANDKPIPLTDATWCGNRLSFARAAPPAKLCYPARTGRPVDISRIIRHADPTDPLFPGEPGLVLESMITHTF